MPTIRTLIALCTCAILLAGCPQAPPEQPEPVTDAPIEDPDEPARFMLLLDDDERDLFAISRPFGDDVLVIVANWSNEAHGMRIPKPAPGHYELVQATTDEPYRIQTDEEGIILEIGARTVQVLRREAAEPGARTETTNARE